MSNILNLPTLQKQSELVMVAKAIANGISDIASKERPFTNVREWRTIQALVRLGLAPQFFQVGDQLECYHERFGTGNYTDPNDPTKTVHKLTWDIIGFDYDVPCDAQGNMITTLDDYGNTIPAHTMTLQLHDCLGTRYPFGTSAAKYAWNTSELRNWLNTENVIDGYSNDAGFKDGLDTDLSQILSMCIKASARNDSSGGLAIRSYENIFIPSKTEIFGNKNNNYNEGAIVKTTDTEINASKYYVTIDTNNVLTHVTTLASGTPVSNNWYEVKGAYDYYKNGSEVSASDDNNETRKKKIGNNYSQYWLRSVVTDRSDSDYLVGVNGNISSMGVIYSYGVSPCCVIA